MLKYTRPQSTYVTGLIVLSLAIGLSACMGSPLESYHVQAQNISWGKMHLWMSTKAPMSLDDERGLRLLITGLALIYTAGLCFGFFSKTRKALFLALGALVIVLGPTVLFITQVESHDFYTRHGGLFLIAGAISVPLIGYLFGWTSRFAFRKTASSPSHSAKGLYAIIGITLMFWPVCIKIAAMF